MTARRCRLASLSLVVLLAPTLAAQRTQVSAPAAVRCYRLSRGEWSRTLGGNAGYHALPDVIRLDTTRATHGGWTVAPDINFPTGGHFLGMPRWLLKTDSVEIAWSNGYQGTTVRLGAAKGDDLRGTVTVMSDANEFGTDVPHAWVKAHRVSCAALRRRLHTATTRR